MRIRPYTPTDSPYLASIRREIWGNDPWSLRYYRFGPDSPPDSPTLFRTLVAEVGESPVGFGSAWTNPFHPHALYVSLNVLPASQRRGLGGLLLQALDQLNSQRLPLQACTWETSVTGVHFLERRGFGRVRRTWEPTLHLAEVNLEAWSHLVPACADLGYSIHSLADLAAGFDHEERLATLLAEVYTATHGLNPPRPMGLEGWIDLLRRDPPNPQMTFLALRGDQYVALSTAHGDDPEDLAIGWTGVTAGEHPHERALILALTLRQIRSAQNHGATTLQAEFDDTNPWSMLQLGAFPFRPAPCWLTFQRTGER